MTPIDFIHNLNWSDIPADVQHQSKRVLLDTLGAGIGGHRLPISKMIYALVAETFGGSGARLWLDGRQVSRAGAAMAHGVTIDGLDIHDGTRPTKGHTGVAIIPSALVYADGLSGTDLLTLLVIGYEIAVRAGVALHATACDYHTSGAWNSLGVAALAARKLGLTPGQTREALGIAEYHGPRSQMMRTIDRPSMVKDGSGWGCMVGITAVQLARMGFTGAPAVTVEGDNVRDFWADLGRRWILRERYFKAYAVCRWAHPTINGVLTLREQHGLRFEDIARVRVHTFHEATRLTVTAPANTEEAQYSLPFAAAAALVHGRLGADELDGAGLRDPQVLDLARRFTMLEHDDCNQRFPTEYLAHVEIDTTDGRTLHSGEVAPIWDKEAPPTDAELQDKFMWLTGDVLGEARARQLSDTVWQADTLADADAINALLVAPAG